MSDYPHESDLKRITEWKPSPDGYLQMMEFVESIWWAADWGFSYEGLDYRISTGGWSGNEDIISAMQENVEFWSACCVSEKNGGHYIFKI